MSSSARPGRPRFCGDGAGLRRIPVKGDGPIETGNDGVVEYSSAHIDGVESEEVVLRSEHSTQGNPETIEEVRRILLEHAAAAKCGVP